MELAYRCPLVLPRKGHLLERGRERVLACRSRGTPRNGTLALLQPEDEIHLGPAAHFAFVQRTSDQLEQACRRVTRSRLAGLSPREAEIARSVARGETNGRIAEQLSIRPRTVATHLEHIFRKLEIASRAELAALVAEAELFQRAPKNDDR